MNKMKCETLFLTPCIWGQDFFLQKQKIYVKFKDIKNHEGYAFELN